MQITRVISGGQTGADIAGLKAALNLGIQTGGTAPKGFLTEDGPNPKLKEYGVVEHTSEKYPPRTKKNIQDSDITILIAQRLDQGSKLTFNLCQKLGKPVVHVPFSDLKKVGTIERVIKEIKELVGSKAFVTMNVAGNRESKTPGIEALSVKFLERLWGEINHDN